MSNPPPLLLAGATGLIGHEVVAAARSAGLDVHALVRRVPPSAADPGVHWQVVDFTALPALSAAEMALCALGTTIKVAGSQAAFRAVDFDAVLAFARAARAAGVRRFGVVSALGAKVGSATFYNRVKGEAEAELAAVGFASLVIARPSLLVGNREALGQNARRGERAGLAVSTLLGPLIPLAWQPIEAAVVARALLTAVLAAKPGVRILESAELQRQGAPTSATDRPPG